MEIVKGVMAIIYDHRGGKDYFLILHRSKGWIGWEFPKGQLKVGETAEEAIVREIREETGLVSFQVKGKMSEQRQFTHDGVVHSFETFVVEANMNVSVNLEANPDQEHDNYLWAPRARVLEKLHWPDVKDYFKEVLSSLSTPGQ